MMQYGNSSFPIIVKDKLVADDLQSLLDRKATAVCVRGAYTEDVCKEIVKSLTHSDLYGRYINAPQIARVGQAFFESQASPERQEHYVRKAVDWIKQIRVRCHPYLTPIDRLRLELDEAWPPGARLATMSGGKMFAGLARHFTEGAEAEPHTDVLEWDLVEGSEVQPISGQIAWNTYLSVPDEGGELTLWDVWPDRTEYLEKKNPDSYGLRRELLPEPIISIRPEVGDMIFFNPGRVHAVERITKGSRFSWSCFIGKDVETEQLTLWS